MKKLIGVLLILLLLIFMACSTKDPSQPTLESPTLSQIALSKYVALGNSLTAGFQSDGMHEDFQAHSFPKFIANQIGQGSTFEQPTISDPGIGSTSGYTPLYLDDSGNITSDPLLVNPLTLLANATLQRPYDNLGVPGAKVYDMRYATNSTTVESGVNPFYDMILRNPNFGNMNQIDQTVYLSPTFITLWIGNNDVLGSMLAGTDELITPSAEFQTNYGAIISRLANETRAGIIIANLPYVTDIPYCNTGDLVIGMPSPMLGIMTEVPLVFDSNFQPVDFDTSAAGELFLPLITSETEIEHLLLSGITAYKTAGLGVPDSAYLYDTFLFPMGPMGAAMAADIEQAMQGAGLITSGLPLTGEYTLTETETTNLNAAVDGYNTFLSGLATTNGIPMVDANAMLTELNTTGIDGYSGKFLPIAAAMGQPTAFSLDGVHLSNGGYAIVANAFIEKINQALGTQIQEINAIQYATQYALSKKASLTMKEIKQIEAIFGLK